jgi:hypothetical protein
MNDLEQRLRFAMVAYVGGCRPVVSLSQVQAALASVGVPESAVSVHSYAPEDFLVVFASAEFRNKVASLPCINHGGFSLFFRTWTRLAQARRVAMRKRVHLVIEGVPPHAWDSEVVEDLLGKGCDVEDVAPETRSREDLSLFKLTAWTSDLDSIPVARTLVVPKPAVREGDVPSPAREFSDESRSPPLRRGIQEVESLHYKVLVHLARVEEDASPEEFLFSSRSPGSGQSGIPDSDSDDGFGGGGRRRIRDMQWWRGLADHRGDNGAGAGGRQRVALGTRQLEAAVPSDWKMPAWTTLCLWWFKSSMHVRPELKGIKLGPQTKKKRSPAELWRRSRWLLRPHNGRISPVKRRRQAVRGAC